jgi:hypothetical protein
MQRQRLYQRLLSRLLILLGIYFVSLLFFSCAARINGPLNPDGSAEFSVNVSLEPRMAALIRNLTAAAAETPAASPILDGPAIALSMSAAPGVNSVSFKNTAPAAIEGPVRISRVNDFLAVTGGSFISFGQGSSGGRCLISLSRNTGPEILSLLSSEITDYLSALMAPLATGESLDKAEYLALVSSVYSRAISDEISRSRIRASINFPGTVRSAKGGTFTGRRADFDIPLLDLLVLETPLSYEVNWD